MTRFSLLILLVFFLNSCYSNNTVLIKRVNLLEERVQFNAQLINENSKRLNSVEFQLEKIKERLAKERRRKNIADCIPPAVVVDNLAKDMVGKSLTKKERQEQIDVSQRGIAKSQKMNYSKNENLGFNSNVSLKNNYKKLYKKALNIYRTGNYTEAEKLFLKFIQEFKNTDLYDNSMYWLAYCYIHLNEDEKAIPILKRIIEEFPTSSLKEGGKTDGAIYALIKIYRKHDNLKKVEYYRSLLLKNFPNSVYTKFVRKG